MTHITRYPLLYPKNISTSCIIGVGGGIYACLDKIMCKGCHCTEPNLDPYLAALLITYWCVPIRFLYYNAHIMHLYVYDMNIMTYRFDRV